MQEKLKNQILGRQKVYNLTAACSEEEYRLLELEQRHGPLDIARESAMEAELDAVLNAAASNAQPTGAAPLGSSLPSSSVLRAHIRALQNRTSETHQRVAQLQSRSKERELKYRHLVSLCIRRPENEIEQLLDGLTRAVESEKGELDITRVRRFLDGAETVVT
jgi:regulatory protein SWI6